MVFFIVVAIFLGVCLWIGIFYHLFWFVPIVLMQIFVLVYLFFRVRWFLKTEESLLRKLSEGEFDVEVDLKEVDIFSHLASQLTSVIRKTGEFERLRRQKVLLYYRALVLILRKINNPVIWVDVEEDVFRLNSEAQKLFGVEQEEYKLSGILTLANNDVFSAWFHKVLDSSEIVPEEFACELALPMSRRPQMLYINAVLVKAGEEKIRLIFLFLKRV